MAQKQPKTVSRRLLGVFVCLCFALQPFGFPLHLAIVEHEPGLPHEFVQGPVAHSHAHPHSHSGHQHHHAHDSERSQPDGTHPPHPVEDHAQFLPDLATSPAPVLLVVLALLPTPLKLLDPPTFSRAVAPCDTPPPRPLPKLVASPRAPPSVA